MGVKVREKVERSGEWWIFINHKGRRRSKKIGDKRTANTVARKVRERLAAGDLGMLRDRCPTIAKYGKKWLDSPLREQAESTLVKYREAFRLHIAPHFGSKRLDEIKKRHVKDFISELKRQVPYVLCDAEDCRGMKLHKITYKADFQYIENGQLIVEDYKSTFTAKLKEWRLKKALFHYRYPEIILREEIR